MSPIINVRGVLKDFSSLFELLPERKRRIRNAPATQITEDPVGDLARRLHPARQHLEIAQVRDEAGGAKTFRLVPDPGSDDTDALAPFRAGQYLSIKVDVDGVPVSRPFSISSSPADALNNNFYEITIRKKEGGFVSEHAWKNWTAGAKLESSGPAGFFYYEPLRDTKEIVGLAGGSGITPFRAMLKDIVENNLDVRFILLYGVNRPEEIIYKEELESIARGAADRIKVHFVCCEPDSNWCGPTGFLTAGSIRRLAGEPIGKTFFICGPQAMYRFLDEELAEFKLPRKRVRREVFGEAVDVVKLPGYPVELAEQTFQITVHLGDGSTTIPAKATESVLVAMERARLAPPSECRSGECGFCMSLLLKGDIYVSPENDGRRLAGKKFGFFHPCSSYPVSDLEIRATRDKC